MQIDFPQALETITSKALELVDKFPTPIILIDGRAGSGKSTLAAQVQEALFKQLEQLPRLIHMDDLYPGWDGLRAGSHYLNQNILTPLANGKTASWQIWDWNENRRGGKDAGNGWREYSGPGLVIVEGCGSLSRSSKALSQLSIWLEVDQATRRTRWIERDGTKFEEYWGPWSAQEDEFYQVEKSAELADLVIRD